jgi:cyclic pyranopterin phosphate synthase
MASGIFRFEGMAADLELLPLAARRALDVTGLKLSLAAWQGLPLDARARLVALGVPDRVDTQAVRALLRDASPEPSAIPVLDEDALVDCDPKGAELLDGRRRLDVTWARLSRLGRFALRHLARRGDVDRLLVAYDELVTEVPLSHLDASGQVHMVDVGTKSVTHRRAVARARVRMLPETARRIAEPNAPKGDVLATVRIAGIMAAKRTSELIPLCHPIPLSRVTVAIEVDVEAGLVTIDAAAETHDRTGVEMEAMVAASVASLALYDMLKGVERGITIEEVVLQEKQGGRSGHYRRSET